MRSFRDLNPRVVGIVSVLVIGALVGAAFAVGTFNLLERTYEMEGEFTDAGGLRVGDEVRVAGVNVGRVTSVEADRSRGTVRVVWVVNRGVDLGPDTEAEIALATLLGAKYLRLSGPVVEPHMADLPREQRVIPLERTRTPFDIFELTRIATEDIEATDNEALNRLIRQLADITEGKRTQLAEIVTGIDRLAREVNAREAELASLLERTERLTSTLADKDRTLLDLIDASQGVLDMIVRRRDDLARALGEGSRAVTELSRLVDVNRARIDAILDTVHPTLAEVESNLEDVNRGLAWLGPAFLQQALAGSHGPWVDIFVRSLGPDVLGVLSDLYDLDLTPEAAP